MTTLIRTGQKALRKARASIPDQMYFVTMVCHDRKRVFSNWEDGMTAAKILTEKRLWRNSSLLCWVLMPDHWHGLIQLSDEESLSKLMQRVKAVSAQSINMARKSKGAVWQQSFYDHALRSQEDVRAVAEYIIANPIRAGLVDELGQYPFWGAYWLNGAGDVL